MTLVFRPLSRDLPSPSQVQPSISKMFVVFIYPLKLSHQGRVFNIFSTLLLASKIIFFVCVSWNWAPLNWVPLPSLWLISLSKAVFPFLSCPHFPWEWGVSKKSGGGGQKGVETKQDPAWAFLVQRPLHIPCFLFTEKGFGLQGFP